jgi:ubiquitin conjugation factor E4 B
LAKLASQTTSLQPSSQGHGASNSPAQSPLEFQRPEPSSPYISDSNVSSSVQPLRQSGTAQEKRFKMPSLSSNEMPPPPQSTPPLPGKRLALRTEENVETFEDRTLRALFKTSLTEGQQQDIHGQPLIYLPGVRRELEEQGQELRMEVGILEQALLEAASSADRLGPLNYLLPCWKRIRRLYKGFRRSHENDPKFNIVQEARRLCISYCMFAISMPEMFGYVAHKAPTFQS